MLPGGYLDCRRRQGGRNLQLHHPSVTRTCNHDPCTLKVLIRPRSSPSLALNIPAALILGPLSFVLSPRAFHRVNVFLIRISVSIRPDQHLVTHVD